MKNLAKYVHSCSEAFFNFIKNDDLERLINYLKDLEISLVENQPSKNIEWDIYSTLWFKFSKDDTGATDIEDIQRTFTRDTKENQEYLREQIKRAISLQGELYVYFS